MIDVKEYNLGDNVEFIGYDSEEEWHKLRQKGIGGSDTGAIMGLNKYTSPLKLYRTKIGLYAEDDSDNVYIKKGKDLEGLIFEKYVKPDFDLDVYKIIHPEHVFVNKQYPWLRANCDGLAVCQNESAMLLQKHIVIEIKWVSEWAEVNWDGDDYCGIPASYYAQVQHYMTVTGARVAYLYAMFDRDWTVKKYVIPYNSSFCLKMLSQTREFYANMQAGIEPKITATLDKCFMPSALAAMPEKTIETEEMNNIIAEYLAVKEDIKNLEKQATELYDKAVQRYLDGERPTSLFKMNISACKNAGFDSKRFAADHPDVYEQYKTVTEYTRTTIKKR
jgi:putative phage-type endonuclease